MPSRFGAAEVIDPTAHDMVAAIRELTHGEGRDVGLCRHLGKSRLELSRFPHAELVKLQL